MTHDEYINKMAEFGYTRETADRKIFFPKDPSDTKNPFNMSFRVFNFVPVGDGMWQIWNSDDRDYFYRVHNGNREFLGTLGEAYQFVYDDTRKWFETHPRK